MPETKPQILSTKQLAQQYIDYAADKGIVIECKSFIRIQPVSAEAFHELFSTLSNISTVVFTSEPGVKIVTGFLANKQLSWNVYCISGTTKRAVSELLPNATIVGTAEYGKDLAAKIVADGVGEVVFFCSEIRMPTIPETLKAKGIKVTEVVAYHNLPAPEKLERAYDGVMFFSPSAIRSFFSLNHITADVPFFAIGKTTAAALKQYPNPIIASEHPDVTVLIDTIINHYKALNAGQ